VDKDWLQGGIMARAVFEYYRHDARHWDEQRSGVVEFEGRRYAALGNGDGLLWAAEILPDGTLRPVAAYRDEPEGLNCYLEGWIDGHGRGREG